MRSGRGPANPRTSALSVAWPLPVQASDPKTVTTILFVFPATAGPSRPTKVAAAFIGPMVWEDEGPIPILKRSRTPIGNSTVLPSRRAARANNSDVGVKEDSFDTRHSQLSIKPN